MAAIPYHIVSPSSTSPIIGIFQDSLLGCFRFSRANINFSKRDAMNLLMSCNKINLDEFSKILSQNSVSSFELLSQILPPLTLKYNTKLYKDDGSEDSNTSNNVLEIRNGKYIRGQIEKSVMMAASNGILHRVFMIMEIWHVPISLMIYKT